MSYYIFHKKYFIGLSDGRICPVVYYSDSRTFEPYFDKNGHERERLAKSYAVLSLTTNHFLCDRTEWEETRENELKEEMEHSADFHYKLGEDKEITLDDTCYYGTHYPSGSKYKDRKSFYSLRRTIPAEKFFSEHQLCIRIRGVISGGRLSELNPVMNETHWCSSETQLIEAQNRLLSLITEQSDLSYSYTVSVA